MASRYRYRVRRRWRRRDRRNAAIAVAAGLALALLAHVSAAGHGVPDAAARAAIPAGSAYTPQTWAAAFLGAIGEPQTVCNVAAVVAWESAEGGAWNNPATANPLNTAMPEPGSHAINSAGVQAYPSWQEGLQGNVSAITNGLYGGVLSALQAGDSARAVADAVAASPWGTEPFQAACT